jgi:nicotinamidase-related amidase
MLHNAALVIIDVQMGFDHPCWGKRNNPQAEGNIALLLEAWRRTGRPVVHVRHDSVEPNSPLRPFQPGNGFKPEVQPLANERVESKHVNSAFIGTGLESYLRQNGYETVVLVGLTTDHCVSTSTRMAGNLGFKTIVIADATATFNRVGYDRREFSAETVHACALASLHQEFASVMETVDLLRAVEQVPA